MAEHSTFDGRALPATRAVLVIGAGTMGSGIAEVAATAGHRVILRDASAAALDKRPGPDRRQPGQARASAGASMRRSATPILARLVRATDGMALDDVGLVIEVIVERLDVKVAVLGELEAQVAPDAIIATNTSSLSVTAIAGRLARPDRVVGMHFFNPATILPLVEVVQGHATAPSVTQTIVETARAWGKVPVVCKLHARLHRQPRGAPLLRRGAAAAAGAGRDAGDAGRRDARMRRLQDGAVRADGPHRA